MFFDNKDCDFDSDCDIGLACFQRSAGDDGVVPGCSGNANDIATGSEDFCMKRPSDNYLISAFDDIQDADFGLYPLPNCAGDCDSGRFLIVCLSIHIILPHVYYLLFVPGR